MSTQTTQAAVTVPPVYILYTLFYREGRNPHPQSTFFYHTSRDMKIVVERAKRHCDVMNYRFVQVYPSIRDLDKEENMITHKD